jgi:hypothetical protein
MQHDLTSIEVGAFFNILFSLTFFYSSIHVFQQIVCILK